MDIAIIIIAILCILIGLIGSILPALPGPSLAYGGLLILLLGENSGAALAQNGYLWLIILGFITLFISIADYYMPIWGTKKFGGTKAGARGSTIGLIVAVILTFISAGFAVILIIAGPFIGAYIGEKQAGQSSQIALQSAKGSFLGFIAGTFMKIVVVLLIAIYCAIVLL